MALDEPRNPYGFVFRNTYAEREAPPRTYFDRVGVAVTERKQKFGRDPDNRFWTISGVGVLKYPAFFKELGGTPLRHCFMFFADPTSIIKSAIEDVAKMEPVRGDTRRRRRAAPDRPRGSASKYAEKMAVASAEAAKDHPEGARELIFATFRAKNAVAAVHYYRNRYISKPWPAMYCPYPPGHRPFFKRRWRWEW